MKTTAKTSKKNSSHKAKRAPVNELRWAVVDDDDNVCVMGPRATRYVAEGWPGRVIRVRVVEVTK